LDAGRKQKFISSGFPAAKPEKPVSKASRFARPPLPIFSFYLHGRLGVVGRVNSKLTLKQLAGTVMGWCLPGLSKAVAAGDSRALSGKVGQLIHLAQTQRAARRQAWPELRQRLAGYWKGGEGDKFYDAYPERFEEWFLKSHYPMVEALVEQAGSGPFTRLYEIGCGDGRVLEHMAGRLPQLESLTGLDINPGIIERNRKTFAGNPRLAFAADDAKDWLRKQAQPGSILLTYGGVWEYFTQEELKSLFAHFRREAAPALIGLVEPLGPDFDAAREKTSRPYGLECSFSHPHRHLLEEAGFTIVFDREVQLDHRWKMMVARAD
jgi:SAM-dependent methyltransferase